MKKTISTKDLRNNFNKYANDVSKNGDVILITRPNNKNLVLLSEKEFNSWRETNYLLSSKANTKALRKGMDDESKSHVFTPEDWERIN